MPIIYRNYLLVFLIASFFLSCAAYKSEPTEYYLDETGKSIEGSTFMAKFHDSANPYAAWNYIAKDSGMVSEISHLKYETYLVSYEKFLLQMEQLTGKNFYDNPTFILSYNFRDDYCTNDRPPNDYSKIRINQRFNYLNPKIKTLKKEYRNTEFLKIFESGISLPEFSEKQRAYFFLDSTNFLREKVFRNPTLCGSYAIIKPNGQMLIRNGEYGLSGISNHLDPDIWNTFFDQ
ncbi:hypothetical protein [Christiangramia sediminis]|uniref:Lipoprotein n=1 Tax=Christiangramia sediminis TaxID=2881336 RepID=A0A9X1LJ37_9FLAO|nr:hypothetical protein [Christiangramia sediminis]MCB7481169.1 hypothetical protein [Christiangramia sediminis]